MTAASFNSKNKTFNCLSVVMSAYNEQDNIIPLYRKLKRNLVSLQKKHFYNNYEIFFINDGSTDQTKNRIETLCLKDKHVKIISLRKNFGKSTALQTGFHYTKGDVIITLDADMQDDPDEISRFITKIQEGYDIVSGWKINRLDLLEKRIMSKIFNFITRKLSAYAYMIVTADLRLTEEMLLMLYTFTENFIATFPFWHRVTDLASAKFR